MDCFVEPGALRHDLAHARRNGGLVAFVPTMGYLHEGHAALIRHAARRLSPNPNSRIVVSVFVNPLQFGPSEDFERYPRNLERDQQIAAEAGATDLFMPERGVLTPPQLVVEVDPGPLADVLCGASRPGHFRGVTTIVTKLFNIVQPDLAVFGWKDAQQLLILKKMVRDLDFPVEVEGIDTVREPDGLAMSSRNTYLSETERRQAPWLNRALGMVRDAVAAGERDVARLRELMRDAIGSNTDARIDYMDAVSMDALRPVTVVEPGNTLLAVAAFFGKTRLIDNVRL